MMTSAAGLTLDTAYQQINHAQWNELIALANSRGVFQLRDQLWQGQLVNTSEKRAALHPALRNLSDTSMTIQGQDVMPQIRQVWQSMKHFCEHLNGVTDVICLGIGGSDWGPRLVCDALAQIKPASTLSPRLHFVANIDSAELATALALAKPHSTRVLITSKTFTTLETLQNAHSVVGWLKDHQLSSEQIQESLVAITANPSQAKAFGVKPEQIYPFWDWVGGRFSVWSAVGLPIAIQSGFSTYQDFLRGAHDMDQHFLQSPAQENLPLISALTLLHNQKQHACSSYAVIPYAHALRYLPDWLQQLEMESHGKSMSVDGKPVSFSSPVVFGSSGSNAQHTFFQMLHQGQQIIPVEFIAVTEPMSTLPYAQEHHDQLLANCLAQAQALALGSKESDPYLTCPGQRPSNLLLIQRLDAYHLGALLAFFEHRALCLGALWGINTFDQPGVELGKKLAKPIHTALSSKPSDTSSMDAVTAQRINLLKH